MKRLVVKFRGFTLIEILVTVAIVAILATIAYPSYMKQIQKSRRTDAKAALLSGAVQMQRYYTERNTYATATLGSTGIYPSTSENGYYTLTLADLSATTFTLKATPVGPQADDSCGTFTYNEQGSKDVSGATQSAADCWK